MATKIRLQRGGRKGYAVYRIVIADARAPRDGKFTEKIGTYNPNTNPATVDLNFDRALYWVEVGAQPTDTVRNILSREGVYMMKHLKGGVKKGAFDEAAAQRKFDAWKADKQNGLNKIAAEEAKAKKDAEKQALEAEKKVNEAIAAKVADTVRNILSREGVYMMKHLKGGVKKGAFDEAAAQRKFDAWKADKQNGLNKIAAEEAKAKKDAEKQALEAEKKVNEAIAAKVAEKKAAAAAAKAEAEAAAEAPAEETPAEA